MLIKKIMVMKKLLVILFVLTSLLILANSKNIFASHRYLEFRDLLLLKNNNLEDDDDDDVDDDEEDFFDRSIMFIRDNFICIIIISLVIFYFFYFFLNIEYFYHEDKKPVDELEIKFYKMKEFGKGFESFEKFFQKKAKERKKISLEAIRFFNQRNEYIYERVLINQAGSEVLRMREEIENKKHEFKKLYSLKGLLQFSLSDKLALEEPEEINIEEERNSFILTPADAKNILIGFMSKREKVRKASEFLFRKLSRKPFPDEKNLKVILDTYKKEYYEKNKKDKKEMFYNINNYKGEVSL